MFILVQYKKQPIYKKQRKIIYFRNNNYDTHKNYYHGFYFDTVNYNMTNMEEMHSYGFREHKYGPTSVWYYDNGNIKVEKWFKDRHFHRIGGPALIEYLKSGMVLKETWYEHDNIHRIGAPAVILYYENGDTENLWYRDGVLCRVDPWHRDGLLHRVDPITKAIS